MPTTMEMPTTTPKAHLRAVDATETTPAKATKTTRRPPTMWTAMQTEHRRNLDEHRAATSADAREIAPILLDFYHDASRVLQILHMMRAGFDPDLRPPAYVVDSLEMLADYDSSFYDYAQKLHQYGRKHQTTTEPA